MLDVIEIFSSVQGEGTTIGRPAVFVRFAGCNLKCSFCDTAYAQDSKSDEVKGYYPIDLAAEVSREISENITDGVPLVVLTGGEPLIQHTGEMLRFMNRLKDLRSRCDFMVETNGSVLESKKDLIKLVSHWVVSPKLESLSIESYLMDDCFLMQMAGVCLSTHIPPTFELKFVVTDPMQKSLACIEEFLKRFTWKAKRSGSVPTSAIDVVLQPNGQELNDRGLDGYFDFLRGLQEGCRHFGREVPVSGKYLYRYRVLPQIHRLLWGNTRRK